jgi:hypothetical protein
MMPPQRWIPTASRFPAPWTEEPERSKHGARRPSRADECVSIASGPS